MAIHFLFNIKNDPKWNPGTVFYYNGDINSIQGVHNTEELKYIAQTYQETNERGLKSYVWDANIAPVYIRLFGVLNPDGADNDTQKALDELQKLVKAYIDVYGRPTYFLTKMRLNVRKTPDKWGEVIGVTSVNQGFDVLDYVLACDYYWAKINFNGQTGWVATGDILGEEYGVKSRK